MNILPPEKTGIKVLAFDQGGIYIGVDYDKTVHALAGMGATNADMLYTKGDQTRIIDDFECGKITPDAFYTYLRENLQGLHAGHATDSALYAAWNDMLTGVIPGVLDWITSLRALGYITVVVSNADQIHQEGVEAQIKEANACELFDAAFDAKFISYQVGFNKPYTNIFQEVQKRIQTQFPNRNIQANEIFFVDDSEKHISGRNKEEGAINVGWKGLLVPSNLPVHMLRTEVESSIVSNH